MDSIKKETIKNVLDKYIDRYDKIIENKNETKIRKCIAETEKNLVKNIMEDIFNAETEDKGCNESS